MQCGGRRCEQQRSGKADALRSPNVDHQVKQLQAEIPKIDVDVFRARDTLFRIFVDLNFATGKNGTFRTRKKAKRRLYYFQIFTY